MNVEPIVLQITAYGIVFVSDLCAQDRIMYHREPLAARPSHRGSRIANVRQPTGSVAQSANVEGSRRLDSIP